MDQRGQLNFFGRLSRGAVFDPNIEPRSRKRCSSNAIRLMHEHEVPKSVASKPQGLSELST